MAFKFKGEKMKRSIITGFYERWLENGKEDDINKFYKEGEKLSEAIIEAERKFNKLLPAEKKKVNLFLVYTIEAIKPETHKEKCLLNEDPENYLAISGKGNTCWYIPTPSCISELECMKECIAVVIDGIMASKAETDKLENEMKWGYNRSLGLHENYLVNIFAYQDGHYIDFIAKVEKKDEVSDSPTKWKKIYTFYPVNEAAMQKYANKYIQRIKIPSSNLIEEDKERIANKMYEDYQSSYTLQKGIKNKRSLLNRDLNKAILNLKAYQHDFSNVIFPEKRNIY